MTTVTEVASPTHKMIAQTHKGVVVKSDDLPHPKYAAPLGTKKVTMWRPTRVRT